MPHRIVALVAMTHNILQTCRRERFQTGEREQFQTRAGECCSSTADSCPVRLGFTVLAF